MTRGWGEYEAAAGGRRSDEWYRTASDPNTANHDIVALRQFARDLHRNNGWARRIVEVLSGNIVGWGIGSTVTGEDEEAADDWKQWCKNCDVRGRNSLDGLILKAVVSMLVSGEILFRRRITDRGLQIELLESDYIDTARDGVFHEGNRIVQGVELDKYRRPVAYWLFPDHPGARLPMRAAVSQRVDATDIIHRFREDRPDQVRGVTVLAPAISVLQDAADLDDAVIAQQKTAACFAGVITSPEGSPVKLGTTVGELSERIEPGTMARLQPGQTISFATPPANAQYDVVVKRALMRLASAVGLTYPDLSQDSAGSSFSSDRLSRLVHWTQIRVWQWMVVIPALEALWRWFCEWYEIEDAEIEWRPPSMPMIEPDKEGLAYMRLMRGSVMSGIEVAHERGRDPHDLVKEIAEWQAMLDEHKVVSDSDPRRTNSSGALQSSQPSGQDDGDDQDDEQPPSPRPSPPPANGVARQSRLTS